MKKSLYKPIGETENQSDSSERPYRVFYNDNMGNRTFILRMPIYDFFRMSEVANELSVIANDDEVAQRNLDPNHSNKLARYILKGLIAAVIQKHQRNNEPVPSVFFKIQKLVGIQAYLSLQPLVCNIRNCKPNGTDLKARPLFVTSNTDSQELASHEVLLSQKHMLWVIDGQHRRRAIELVFNFLDDIFRTHTYPNRKAIFPVVGNTVDHTELQLWIQCNEIARTSCSVIAEVHLGLNIEKERQLFHDLNNLVKKVETSTALKFDRGNPISVFVQDTLIKFLGWSISEKDIVNWQDDTGEITLKDLVSINTRLILNRTSPKGATPVEVEPKINQSLQFWQAIKLIPYLGKKGAKVKTVAAQPVMLKALAKLFYDFAYGRSEDEENLKILLKNIPKLNFSHDYTAWRYYTLSEAQRKRLGISSLKNYLPNDDNKEADFNRDIGGYDSHAKVMRFGAKHNDIYPILGDIIRWQLNLPTRHKIKE